jgi:hypothetical protein
MLVNKGLVFLPLENILGSLIALKGVETCVEGEVRGLVQFMKYQSWWESISVS